MSAKHDLERRIADFYETEAPPAAPDWLLREALATIDVTPQRRVLMRMRWRFQTMNTYARFAAAAVAVVVVGTIGYAMLGPGRPSDTGGGPTPSPTVTASSSPTPSLAPSGYVPPNLTETFTSDIHGISVSYPVGWMTQAATDPWAASSLPLFREPSGDFLYDPVRTDHLFLAVASQALVGVSFDQWATDLLGAEDCGSSEAVEVDGAEASGIASDCNVAVAWAGGRGYAIWLHTSPDDFDLRAFDSRAWFEEVLATVQLRPESAIDVAPSASP